MSTITTAVIIGVFLSMLASLLAYYVSRYRVFQQSLRVIEAYSIPEKPRSKSELRKYRKLKAIVSAARKRVLMLLGIHVAIFVSTYFLMLMLLAVLVGDNEVVYIPIPIPLLTGRSDTQFYTYVYFIGFLAYLTPLYLFTRAVKPKD